MLVACLVFLPFWPSFRREMRANGHLGALALMALCEPCLFFLCETNALRFTSSSQAGMRRIPQHRAGVAIANRRALFFAAI